MGVPILARLRPTAQEPTQAPPSPVAPRARRVVGAVSSLQQPQYAGQKAETATGEGSPGRRCALARRHVLGRLARAGRGGAGRDWGGAGVRPR